MEIDESWYRRPPGIPEHTSAGGVIVRFDEGRVYIALVREGNRQAYVLPKGHVQEGEGLEQAARREIMEESGLVDLTLRGELGVRERLDHGKASWKRTHYFLFTTAQRQGMPTDQTHPCELEWFPLDALPAMFWPEQHELVVGHRDSIIATARQDQSGTPW